VAESTNSGTSFTDRSGGLTTSLAGKIVTALLAKGDGIGALLNFYAIGNGKVYKENGSWVWDTGSVIPFTPGPLGVSVANDSNQTLLMANSIAAADKVEIAPQPYTTFTNKTDSFPASGQTPSASWVI